MDGVFFVFSADFHVQNASYAGAQSDDTYDASNIRDLATEPENNC
jgi:hypothetical protein